MPILVKKIAEHILQVCAHVAEPNVPSARTMFALLGGFGENKQPAAHTHVLQCRTTHLWWVCGSVCPTMVENSRQPYVLQFRNHRPVDDAFSVRVRRSPERPGGRRPVLRVHARTDESGRQHTPRGVGQRPGMADNPHPATGPGRGGL